MATLSLTELAAEYRRIEADLLDRWDAPIVNDFLCMIAFGAARKALEGWAGAEGTAAWLEAIGRAAADIAFTALGEVAVGFSSDPVAVRTKLDAARVKLDARLADSVSANRFDGRDVGRGIAEAVGEAIPNLIGDIVGGAISAAFSGDKSRLERMERLDAEIEAAVAPRAAALEQRSKALCQRLEALDALDNALEFRLPDGQPLQLLRVDAPVEHPPAG